MLVRILPHKIRFPVTDLFNQWTFICFLELSLWTRSLPTERRGKERTGRENGMYVSTPGQYRTVQKKRLAYVDSVLLKTIDDN